MAFTVIGSATAASPEGATDPVTTGFDTTGADLLIVGVSVASGDTPTVTDSNGNTYTGLTAQVVGGGEQAKLFYCDNPTVGASHTFTGTDAGLNCIFALAVSGTSGSTFESTKEAGADTFGTTLQPGSLTPGADNALVVQLISWNTTANTVTIDGSYTILTSQYDRDGTNHLGGAMAYLIQTTATATNPTWTQDTATSMACRAAVFELGAGGGGGGSAPRPGTARMRGRIG